MIIVKLAGGLGNQMFQYAAGKALALKHGTELLLDTSSLLDRRPRKEITFREFNLDLFNIRTQIIQQSRFDELRERDVSRLDRLGYQIRRVFDQELPQYHREYRKMFDERFFQLPFHVYLEGYWQSEDYFSSIKDVIRSDFSLKQFPDVHGMDLMNRIMNCNSVCLNVRRGSYVSQPFENKFHGTCSIEYFYNAVKRITHDVPDIKIFVFSDDIEWCRQQLHFNTETTIVDHSYAGEKFGLYLNLMSHCKHFVIPNSTFGWWAAWLAKNPEKIVIAPKQWYQDRTIETSRLIPRGWIRI